MTLDALSKRISCNEMIKSLSEQHWKKRLHSCVVHCEDEAWTEFKKSTKEDCGVGKTATTKQYIQGWFVEDYDATIEDSYRKKIKFRGGDVVADIFDVAGLYTNV